MHTIRGHESTNGDSLSQSAMKLAISQNQSLLFYFAAGAAPKSVPITPAIELGFPGVQLKYIYLETATEMSLWITKGNFIKRYVDL